MEDKGLSQFGLGILGALFCYNEEKAQEMKVWFGKWVYERGGSEQVWNDYRNSLPQDTPKEKVIEMLEECVKAAVAEGAIKNDVRFKRDYKIVIAADNNDNVYCQVSRKGEFASLTDEDNKIVSEMISEINEKINYMKTIEELKKITMDEANTLLDSKDKIRWMTVNASGLSESNIYAFYKGKIIIVPKSELTD